MLFTANAQLATPQLKQMFTHFGFPNYFRVELSLAKIFGVLILLAPAPSRPKEWAYAGFAITLASALIAHLSVGDGAAMFMWSAVAGVILGLSYYLKRKISTDCSRGLADGEGNEGFAQSTGEQHHPLGAR
jgi:hypothetical protein